MARSFRESAALLQHCHSLGRSAAGPYHYLGAIGRIGLIIAHLGNGASLTAVKDGQSIDTSMGLTPTGGVIMGTCCGDLDPGALVYLVRERTSTPRVSERWSITIPASLEFPEIDGDMRRLHEASRSNADARPAIQMFCYSIRKQP